jgi:hypothetical protein
MDCGIGQKIAKNQHTLKSFCENSLLFKKQVPNFGIIQIFLVRASSQVSNSDARVRS